MTFKEWYLLQEEGPWGGASFDGTSAPYVNTPDYWPNSKYQGHGIGWNAPSFMKYVDKKYGGKHHTKDTKSPIEDRVPKMAQDERNKEQKQGKQYRSPDSDDGDNIGDDTIHASNDPMLNNKQARKVNQLYKLTPTYELK
jgi:hypothetical protein